jgi:hypothetical protein
MKAHYGTLKRKEKNENTGDMFSGMLNLKVGQINVINGLMKKTSS